MPLDPAACYRALRARDARSDGRFFVCVKTTGIYCRPICPARPARFENVRFLPSAAAAQAAGFRPCLRCRPELSPDVAAWRGTQATVSRALALIAEGALDGETSMTDFAERLGLGERQLRRLFERHLGAAPVAVAQTRRLLFAKQLVQETQLSMTDVALAAGFGSVRRFNAVFQALYGRAPATLRRGAGQLASSTVTLRLGYRPPYDWDSMLSYLAARAIAGVERIEGQAYLRTLQIGEARGTLEVKPGPTWLQATLRIPSVIALPAVVARLRRAFDLDADVQVISAHLARDPRMAALVARRPGLRLPGGWDPFEQSVRAILGQQVTVAAAQRLAGKLVALAGPRLGGPLATEGPLDRLFPTPADVLAADLRHLPMPAARRESLVALARVAQSAPPDAFETLDQTVARLRQLEGFGDWTAHQVALRAFGHADAFPSGDVVLRRAATRDGAQRLTAAALEARAERWRPWRGYAAQHLWSAGSSGSKRGSTGDARKVVRDG